MTRDAPDAEGLLNKCERCAELEIQLRFAANALRTLTAQLKDRDIIVARLRRGTMNNSAVAAPHGDGE